MALSEADMERIAAIVRDREPTRCPCLDDEVHTGAHEVLKRWIQNDIDRKVRNEKIKATVLGGLILGAIAATGNGALAMMDYLRDHLK